MTEADTPAVPTTPRQVFMNDRPYTDKQEDPHASLRDTLAFSVDNWGSSRAMAWTWGIINGWDDEAMEELALLFGWDLDTTARLNRLHAAFEARPTPAEALDPEVLWSVLAGIGVLDNGTWVRFDRDDADRIADAYAAEYARRSPESDR